MNHLLILDVINADTGKYVMNNLDCLLWIISGLAMFSISIIILINMFH